MGHRRLVVSDTEELFWAIIQTADLKRPDDDKANDMETLKARVAPNMNPIGI